jgi:hypothetical protein
LLLSTVASQRGKSESRQLAKLLMCSGHIAVIAAFHA